MQLFYAPQIVQNSFVLDETESRHCIQVLRHKLGDTIQLIDGIGGRYTAIITHAHPKKCAFEIQKTIQLNTHPFDIHIGIAPTKNISRFEWFLEKATEIGVNQITPLLTQRSERRKLRVDRLQKILITAMKQSTKAHLPQLNPLILLQKFIDQEIQKPISSFNGIAYLTDNNQTLSKVYTKGRNALILIGPEGDFTPEEINFALQRDFEGVSLGNSRLRTETAGIIACHTLHLVNE